MDKTKINKIMSEIGQVTLVAVSKRKSVSDLVEAIGQGIDIFAENKIQEAEEKHVRLKDIFEKRGIKYHFIGHLQSNKVKKAVRMFDMIQSVDSLKISEKIDSEAKKIGKIQDILIQVNIGKEPQKYGIMPEDAGMLIPMISSLPNLRVRGLMCIPPKTETAEKSRKYFKQMKKLSEKYKTDILSMGMSNDYNIAIEEGSNMIRIGTAIFGKRD